MRLAGDVTETFQHRHGLGRGLLGDLQPSSELGDRHAVRADGLECETVHGTDAGMACVCQLGVQLVDQRPERPDHQQWQFEPGTLANHGHTLSFHGQRV